MGVFAGGQGAEPDQGPVLGHPDGARRHVEHVPRVLGGQPRHHPEQEQPPLRGGQAGEQGPGETGVDVLLYGLLGPGAPVGQVGQDRNGQRRAGGAARGVRHLVRGDGEDEGAERAGFQAAWVQQVVVVGRSSRFLAGNRERLSSRHGELVPG